jgi:hypothetical protein
MGVGLLGWEHPQDLLWSECRLREQAHSHRSGCRGSWISVSREGVSRHPAKSRMLALATSWLKPVPLVSCMQSVRLALALTCRTGFSREGVKRHAAKSRMLALATSRLKPVPLMSCMQPVRAAATRTCGTGFSREGVRRHAAKSRMLALASSRLKPVPPMSCMQAVKIDATQTCRTGFSREGVRRHAAKSRMLTLGDSRLKPVPLMHRTDSARTGTHPTHLDQLPERNGMGWRGASGVVCGCPTISS